MSRQDQLDALNQERSSVEAQGQQERAGDGSIITQPPYNVVSADTNTVSFSGGLQGSLTQLVDGTSYLVGGNGITIASASNGPITISAAGEGEAFITGNDGEVQFNGDMNLSGDTNFLYDATSQVLTVTNISGSLTRLVDGTSYIKAGEGVTVVSSSNGSILISKSSQPDISSESWQSYTPIIGDHAQGGSPNIILPTSKTIKGSYIHHSGFMKLIFDLSAPENSGAVAGTGTYTVTLPVGFEIDTSVVSLGSTANLSSGMSIGQASLLSDVVGAGGSWSVVPLAVNKLMLVGKNPASTSIVSWGGENIPVNSGNDLKVSFVATIPVVGSGVSEGLIVAIWTSNDAVGTNNSSFLTEGGTLPVQVLDGLVSAIAPDNDGGYYVGGTFTKLVNGFESDRGGFDVITTGQVSTRPFANFNVNGLVHCLVPDSAGGAFIAGTFTSVKGQTRNRIARINSDGTLSDWYPTGGATSGRISCMHYDTESGYLYVGGTFTNIGGIARSRIARINVSTAAVDSTWIPTLNAEPYAITSGGGFIYAGGAFTTATPAAGGVAVATQYLTKWNKTTGAVSSMTLTSNTNTRVWCLTADATHVYVGGTHVISNGRRLSRYLHTETTRDLTWQMLYGDNIADTTRGITSIKLDNDFVYTTCNFSGTPFTGAPTRAYVAKLRKDSVAVESWYPTVDAAIYDCAIDVANNRCYFIGDFTTVNSTSRRGLAAVTLDNNGTTNIDWDGRTEDRIGAVGDKLEILGGNLWVGTSNASPSWAIARLARVLKSGRIDTSWNPGSTGQIIAIVSDSTHAYVGGVGGTIGGLTSRNLVRFAHGIPTADSTWTTSTLAIAGVPRITGNVYSLAIDNVNDKIYVGTDGYFNATTQAHIGRLNKLPVSNNAVLDSWNPSIDYVGSSNAVLSIALADDKVYFTGNFTEVNSTILRDGFACVNASDATVIDKAYTSISTNSSRAFPKHPVVADSDGAWVATDGYQQHGTLVGISKNPTLHTKDVNNSLVTPYPKFTDRLNVDGYVYVVISDNNGGYFVGGVFSSIQGFPITNLAWIGSDGLVKKNWAPSPNASVYMGGLHLDGNMLYVTGQFTSIGGSGANGKYIARINITGENATYDSTWTPGSTATRRILSAYPGIQTDDNYVYVALGESHGSSAVAATTLSPSNVIAGTTVYGICRITKSSPAVATQWISEGTKGSSGDSTYAYISGIFSLQLVGNTLYTAGGFVNVANANRNRMAAFDVSTGELLDWNPGGGDYWNRSVHYSAPWVYTIGGETTWNITPPAGTTSRGSFDVLSLDHTHPTMRPNSSLNADARTRAMAPDGTGGAFIGGEFTTVGGLSRNKIARINSNGELHTGYCPALGGTTDNVYTVYVHDGKLYAGGAVTNFVNHPNDVDRGTFDIINVPDELALNPNVNNVVRPYTNFQANGAVYAMVDVGDGVIIGGAFTSVSGYTRNRIAKVLYSGEVDPFWNPGDVGVGNGAVYALYWDGSYIYVGGSFTLIGGVSRTRIASLDASGNVSSDWEVLDINTGEPRSGVGGVNGNVYTFAVGSGGLYVGGGFSIIYGPYDTYAEIPVTAYDAALINTGGTPVSLGLLSSDTDGFVSKIISEIRAYPDGNERVYLAGRIERSGRRGLLRLIYDGIAFTLDPAWITSWGAENTETYDIEFSYNNHETEGEKYYLYATGEQTGNLTLNGVAYPRDRIARFVWSDAANDYVMDTSWYPTLNGKCFKIRKNPDTESVQLSSYVYLMGTFTTINSVSVKNLARINEFTGVVDSSLETRSRLRLGTVTDSAGGFSSGDFLITTANDMFIGCTDTTPLVANHICKFDIATGLLDLDWKPTLGGTYPYCNAISVGGAPGGPLYLYAGGVFSSATNIDGTSSTAAFKFCKWNLSTGQVTSLSINTVDSDEYRIWSLACDDDHVYVGTTIAFSSGGPRRLGRYAHNATTWDSSWSMQWGAAGSQWEYGVSSVIIDEDNDCVYASGNFASTVAPALDGKVRQYIARFNRTTRSADDWYPVVNGYISGMWLDKPNNRIFMIGNFTSVNGVPRNNLAWVSTLGTGNQPEDVGQWGCSITSVTGYFYDKIMVQNDQVWVGTLNTSATSEVSYRMARFHPTSGRIDYTWLMNDIGVPGVSAQTVLKYCMSSDDDYVYSGGTNGWGTTESPLSRVSKTTAIQDATWKPLAAIANQYDTNNFYAILIRDNDVLVGGHETIDFRTDTSLIRVNLDGSYSSPLSLVNNTASGKNVMFRRGKYLYVVGTGALNTKSSAGIVNNIAKINIVTGEVSQVGSISALGTVYTSAIVGNKFIIGTNGSTSPFTSPVYSHIGTTNHRLLFVKFTDTLMVGDDLLTTDETDIS